MILEKKNPNKLTNLCFILNYDVKICPLYSTVFFFTVIVFLKSGFQFHISREKKTKTD